MWVTLKECVGIVGLPTDVSNIRRRLDRDCTEESKRKREGSKAFEYHISVLPLEAQKHLRQQQAKAEIAAASEERQRIREKYAEPSQDKSSEEKLQAMSAMASWPESRRNRCFARYEVLMACNEYIVKLKGMGIGKLNAKLEFVDLFNAQTLPFEESIYNILHGNISRVSLDRWQKAYSLGGIAEMDGTTGSRKEAFVIECEPEMKRLALSIIAEFPHIKPRKLYNALKSDFDGDKSLVPAESSVGRWLRWWKTQNASLFTSISNPDEWKNKFMSAFGSASEGIERLNQLWELDATPADLACTLPDGSKRRYHITALIDVWSRVPMLLVTETPRTESNAALMRRAILSEGKPEKVKIDNGSDYVSKAMILILDMLGIEYEICPPFSPWKKPHIERFFRFFSHDLLEMKSGFLGHNVAERKAIEARKTFAERLMKKDEVIDITMTPEELQQFCDDWVDNIYMHKHHEGIKATPFEMRASYQGEITTIKDERALDQLLSVPTHGGMRTITKQGIKIDNIHYIAPELAVLIGQQVHVRLDKDDLGQVVVSDLEGAFICVALNAEYKGVDRETIAQEAKRLQRAHIKEAKKEIAAAKRQYKPREIADRMMENAKGATANVAQFPAKSIEYTNTAIQGASDAVAALDGTESEATSVTQQQMDIVSNLMRAEQKQSETEEDRFRRWLDLNDQLEAGESLDEFNRSWKERYETTAEFKGRYMVWEDFGDSAFR